LTYLVQIKRKFGLWCGLLLLALSAAAGEAPAPQEEPLIMVNEGQVYRKVDGEAITGREVLDLVVEEAWEQGLQMFVAHILCQDEAQDKQISVADRDVDAELQNLLDTYAKRMGIPPSEAKIEAIAQKFGGLAHLRQTVRDNLGVLRALQASGKLTEKAHITDQQFEKLLHEILEKRLSAQNVISDAKKLGADEGVRIGTRSFGRAEVRGFMLDTLRNIPKSELKRKLEILARDKITSRMLAEKKLELTRNDLEFHFSYICRLREIETGVPGRVMVRQDLDKIGLKPEQFLASRLFRGDAALTLLAKQGINQERLLAEFAAHPDRYKRAENLIAHIFICVLDPEGKPYSANWQASGHEPVNQFAAQRMDSQFEAAKPKIESLVAAAKEDFAAAAKKYSEDNKTALVGGVIGRIGAETVLLPPCDKAICAAAAKLKPGEISAPVRSSYGWHLLKCLEKQEPTFEESDERVYLNLIFEARRSLNEKLESVNVKDGSD